MTPKRLSPEKSACVKMFPSQTHQKGTILNQYGRRCAKCTCDKTGNFPCFFYENVRQFYNGNEIDRHMRVFGPWNLPRRTSRHFPGLLFEFGPRCCPPLHFAIACALSVGCQCREDCIVVGVVCSQQGPMKCRSPRTILECT